MPLEGGVLTGRARFRLNYEFHPILNPFRVWVAWLELRKVVCEFLSPFWVWVVAQSSIYESMAGLS